MRQKGRQRERGGDRQTWERRITQGREHARSQGRSQHKGIDPKEQWKMQSNDGWSYADIWESFLKFRRVYAIYSLNRKSRNGGKFGFVRFLNVKDMRELERQLDQIWIGDRKLWVNTPRSYAKVVKGPQDESHDEKRKGENKSRIRHGKCNIDSRKTWKDKGKMKNWSEFEEHKSWSIGSDKEDLGIQDVIKAKLDKDGHAETDVKDDDVPSNRCRKYRKLLIQDSKDVEKSAAVVLDSQIQTQNLTDGDYNVGVESKEVKIVSYLPVRPIGKIEMKVGSGEDDGKRIGSKENRVSKIKERKTNNRQQMEGKTELNFTVSPKGKIARDSIGDNGIQNCNIVLRKQIRDQLGEEIWEIAKQLGTTTQNKEEILQQIDEIERKDKHAKAKMGNQNVGDAKKEKVEFLVIQETKMEVVDGHMCRRLWDVMILTGALWKELINWINSRKGKWCLEGDFNAIRKVRERVGCREVLREMREFDCFIHDAGLVDLPLVGRKYTWYNSNSQYMSRIDRYLLFEEWLMKWSNVKQWRLRRTVSDHCPILLKDKKINWGPKPFKFFDISMEQPGCKEIIRNVWDSTMIKGWKGFELTKKLKRTKQALKEWSGRYMTDVDNRINEAKREIYVLDKKGEIAQLLVEDIEKRGSCFLDL
ncbi:hypothetical protein SLEP1_g13859 [Rubroshorea leprosula]|uniref:RRM domain-containing protein n=1 Tax=Rubroshorea leprosula TaxID=152421 RepID=A0AAV5IRV9_9ROSI|nr:hypothetical protein SLEP1_g13859 [Rubroshorea leprosula]